MSEYRCPFHLNGRETAGGLPPDQRIKSSGNGTMLEHILNLAGNDLRFKAFHRGQGVSERHATSADGITLGNCRHGDNLNGPDCSDGSVVLRLLEKHAWGQ